MDITLYNANETNVSRPKTIPFPRNEEDLKESFRNEISDPTKKLFIFKKDEKTNALTIIPPSELYKTIVGERLSKLYYKQRDLTPLERRHLSYITPLKITPRRPPPQHVSQKVNIEPLKSTLSDVIKAMTSVKTYAPRVIPQPPLVEVPLSEDLGDILTSIDNSINVLDPTLLYPYLKLLTPGSMTDIDIDIREIILFPYDDSTLILNIMGAVSPYIRQFDPFGYKNNEEIKSGTIRFNGFNKEVLDYYYKNYSEQYLKNIERMFKIFDGINNKKNLDDNVKLKIYYRLILVGASLLTFLKYNPDQCALYDQYLKYINTPDTVLFKLAENIDKSMFVNNEYYLKCHPPPTRTVLPTVRTVPNLPGLPPLRPTEPPAKRPQAKRPSVAQLQREIEQELEGL